VLRQWLAEAIVHEQAADWTNMAYLTEPRYFTHSLPEGAPALTTLLERIADERILKRLRHFYDCELLFHNTQYFFEPATHSHAGAWHRDGQFGAPNQEITDEIEQRRYAETIVVHVHIALLADDHFEIVPGSHARWDTPEELAIRRGRAGRQKNESEMPGAVRVRLAAGDACFFSAWSIQRGNYFAHVPRRTFDVIYGTPAEWATPPPTCFLNPEVLEHLSPAARHFFTRFITAHHERWGRGEFDY
jgi:hypothetical protein